MRSAIGIALVLIGASMGDSENLLVPVIVIGIGLLVLRRAICSK